LIAVRRDKRPVDIDPIDDVHVSSPVMASQQKWHAVSVACSRTKSDSLMNWIAQ
jgi:hypothetical protein